MLLAFLGRNALGQLVGYSCNTRGNAWPAMASDGGGAATNANSNAPRTVNSFIHAAVPTKKLLAMRQQAVSSTRVSAVENSFTVMKSRRIQAEKKIYKDKWH